MYYFLGPKSEQRAFLEDVLSLVVNDHVYWRRNFHPKDPPTLSFPDLNKAEADQFRETFYQELFSLISDLKLDVPFFSPRYMAHIISEPSLPGLVAYMATMFYNPNNVSYEASTVTIQYELEVGQQLAALFGFDPKRSFGHLTSGGTVANYESLWFHKAAKFLPVAMRLAYEAHSLSVPSDLSGDYWELMNVLPHQLEAFWEAFVEQMISTGHQPVEEMRKHSPTGMGERAFWEKVSSVWGRCTHEPVVLLPKTAHYSWQRAAGVFGIGQQRFLSVPVDNRFRMCPEAYQQMLEHCRNEQIPVLETVSVVGTTEFGSLDNVMDLVTARDSLAKQGLFSPIHVDAAFGGYFATMFQEGERPLDPELQGLLEQPHMKEGEKVFSAIRHCDSVTVDPHKMGYAPYGAGAFVLRDGFLRHFVSQSASYCFDQRTGEDGAHLGQYILEGSKPGAAAAAVWFSHRMIPLNTDGYGKLMLGLCAQATQFYQLVKQMNQTLENAPFCFVPVNAPSINVVGLLVLDKAASSVSQNNALNTFLLQRFGVRDVESIQQYDYLVSHTSLAANSTFALEHPRIAKLTVDCEGLDVLRFVFMNPWTEKETQNGVTYQVGFLEKLSEECHRYLSES